MACASAHTAKKMPSHTVCPALPRAENVRPENNEQDAEEEEAGDPVRIVPEICCIYVADTVADDGSDAEKADVFFICQITWIHFECPPVNQGHIQ